MTVPIARVALGVQIRQRLLESHGGNLAKAGAFRSPLRRRDDPLRQIGVRGVRQALPAGAAQGRLRGRGDLPGAGEGSAALVDGVVGAAWAPGGEPRVALGFVIGEGRITSTDVVADPEHPREPDVTFL
ncbi:hypothetical protein [Streptosporangium saharense]|uniref:hypothetical protein n=1 Tax=Streptosporangium saharense TaxID=1706840 RepID=UPI003318171B